MNYDRGGYRGRGGGGGGYNNNGGGGRGGRGGGFGGRGGGHGGRGGYNNNGNGEYNNNGGHYDRKRRYDSEYEQRPPKRQYEEPKPDPTPIDFEVEGNVAGQNNRFFYKEKQQVPAQLTAIHTIRIHGRLDNTVSFGNQNDLVMFLANCGGFLKQGVSLMDKSPSTVPMNIQDVSTKMKTICQALLGTCELIEVDTKKLNLLQLPVFGRVPEMKVVIEPESTLEIASIGIKSLIDWLHGRQGKKGMKKLDFYTTNNVFARQFLHKLKTDNADAQYVVRITCPNPPLDEFTYNSGKKSQLKLVKEKDVKGGASFILYKYPEEQPEPSTKVRDAYPKLSQISITNVPMPQPGAAN